MVTGVPTAAVQVAVTCVAGEAERWTEGSLTVQLEFTSAEVFAAHTVPPVNKPEALKATPFAGAAAVWSTVIDPGVTLNPVNVQVEEEGLPPQPAIPNNAAQSRTDANILHGNMAAGLSFVALQKKLYTEPQLRASNIRIVENRLGCSIFRRFFRCFCEALGIHKIRRIYLILLIEPPNDRSSTLDGH